MAARNRWDAAVVVALGSNLPGADAGSRALLEAAVVALGAAGVRVTARSGWWRSAAWPNASAPTFLNGVALVETAEGPETLLETLFAVERAFGRERAARNAARTLDLDLIAYGRVVTEAPTLMLPHRKARERLFVMGPLAEIAPHWRHPTLGRTAAELAATANVGSDARPA